MVKAKKRAKGSTPAQSKSDTSRWESLLAGGGNGGAPLSFTLGSLFSAAAPAATPSNPKANGTGGRNSASLPTNSSSSDKLPTKRREQANGNRGDSVSTSNWEVLRKGDTSSTATINNSGNAPHSVHDKTATKRSKKKKKNGGSPSGIANSANGSTSASSDFFAAKILATSPSFKDKKRKRPNTGAAGGYSNNNISNSGGPSNSHASHQGHPNKRGFRASDPHADNKRPRSNVLNTAFQAQKDQKKAASDKPGDKARDKARGGKGGGKGRGAEQALTPEEQAQYVGLDCEMVGVGPGGCRSALARCCMVDWDGHIIYDKHVTPNERVTDFRTFVSGVQAKHLKGGLTLRGCQVEVSAILKDKVLVGHALHNDLKALLLTHPRRMTRDTATYRPYQKAHGRAGGKLHPKSLKSLALEHLERTIQEGQHHPAEDASAAIDLYKLARHEWEKSLSAAVKMRRGRTVVNQQAPKKKL